MNSGSMMKKIWISVQLTKIMFILREIRILIKSHIIAIPIRILVIKNQFIPMGFLYLLKIITFLKDKPP